MKLRKFIFFLILTTNFCWRVEPQFEVKTEKIGEKRYFSFENKKNLPIKAIQVTEVLIQKPGVYQPIQQAWFVDIYINYESGVIFQGKFEYGENFESFIESKALSKVDVYIQAKPLIEGKKYEIGIYRFQPVRDSTLEFVH